MLLTIPFDTGNTVSWTLRSRSEKRAQLFATIDLVVNVLVLLFQLFLTSRIINWLGFSKTLIIVPLGITIGFGVMAIAPILGVMIAVEVFRRVGDYAVMKPAREMLFSVVTREEKYKAKNFIDTTILRTGSASSSWIYKGVGSLGVQGVGIASVSIALGLTWCLISVWLGKQFDNMQDQNKLSENPHNHNE